MSKICLDHKKIKRKNERKRNWITTSPQSSSFIFSLKWSLFFGPHITRNFSGFSFTFTLCRSRNFNLETPSLVRWQHFSNLYLSIILHILLFSVIPARLLLLLCYTTFPPFSLFLQIFFLSLINFVLQILLRRQSARSCVPTTFSPLLFSLFIF